MPCCLLRDGAQPVQRSSLVFLLPFRCFVWDNSGEFDTDVTVRFALSFLFNAAVWGVRKSRHAAAPRRRQRSKSHSRTAHAPRLPLSATTGPSTSLVIALLIMRGAAGLQRGGGGARRGGVREVSIRISQLTRAQRTPCTRERKGGPRKLKHAHVHVRKSVKGDKSNQQQSVRATARAHTHTH